MRHCILSGIAASIAADDGYIDLGAGGHTYSSRGYAVTSDTANWRTEWFGALGKVRFRAAPAGSGPIFVGTAKPEAVHRYLDGVERTTVHKNTGHGNKRTQHSGNPPESQPAKALRWTASSTGTATQSLRWDAQSAGEQVLVTMNADGSAGVRARIVSSAVTVPALPWIAAGALVAGIILLAGGIALIIRPVRRARAR